MGDDDLTGVAGAGLAAVVLYLLVIVAGLFVLHRRYAESA